MSSYCSIEEAWGQNFNGSNGSKPTNIGGIPSNLHHPELSEGVTFNGKYQNKNDYTRKVHSRRSRKQKIKARHQKTGPLSVDTRADFGNVNYVDMQNDTPEFQEVNQKSSCFSQTDEIPSAYSESGQSMLRPLEADEDEGVLLENMPPYEGIVNSVEQELNDSARQQTVVETDENVSEEDVESEDNSDNSQLKAALQNIMLRLDRLERKIKQRQTSNIHDIVLFVLMGVFILFILDSVFRIGRRTI